MSFQLLQTISTILIFFGVVITGIGGFGQYYFGRKIENEKDRLNIEAEQKLNEKIDVLIKGNDELKENIKPFEELARLKFPDEDVNTALSNLSKEIERIESEHKKTYFEAYEISNEILDDNNYNFKYRLTPVGKNTIPIFMIQCSTKNKVKIVKFDVKGKTLPQMVFKENSKDLTLFRNTYRELYPGEIIVDITTENDPGIIKLFMDPYKEDK